MTDIRPPDLFADQFSLIVPGRALRPLLGVGDGLQLGLQPLAGGVEPSLDGADRGVEPLGHLDQRLPWM